MEFQGPQIGRMNTGLSLVVVVKLGDHVNMDTENAQIIKYFT
jgi:hypothetical protein